MSEVRAASGVPTTANFAGLGAPTLCAPVYVNTATGYIYTLKTGDVVVAAAIAASVTTVSVVTANGVSGSVANPTSAPAITLTLGAITPTSVAASGAMSGSNLSGTNTGDQTNITGNAATVTTNANLTGPITSTGNATAIASGNTYPTPTFSGAVTETPRMAAFQWAQFASSDAAGTLTNASCTSAVELSATNYVTQSCSSGTNTVTFSKAGNYLVTVTGQCTATGASTLFRMQAVRGGNATQLAGSAIWQFVSTGVGEDNSASWTMAVTATAGQTLTILPKAATTGGSAANYNFQMTTTYMGTT